LIYHCECIPVPPAWSVAGICSIQLPLKRQSSVVPRAQRKVNQYPALLAEIQPARPKSRLQI
jgi:hypothetical protein